MATIAQVQNGFTRFVDVHISGAFEGWQKAIVVGGATLIAANMQKLLAMYGNNPVVTALGVINMQAGTIDIDSLYNAFVPHMGADKIPISIPSVGIIKIGREEIDALVKYIKEA